MRRSIKALVAIALVGAAIVSFMAAGPALASMPSRRGYAHHKNAYAGGTSARYCARLYACNGGRTYTFLGGWGCDYYFYPEYAPRRR
jgi:hypothetical protein